MLWHEIEKVQYAVLRLASFFDPGEAPAQVSYQLKQSLIAVGSGGAFGVGFGQGRQQYGFLPFPYSDFIASNIGEEWGFVGLAAVTIAFAAYALLGFRIARKARSRPSCSSWRWGSPSSPCSPPTCTSASWSGSCRRRG